MKLCIKLFLFIFTFLTLTPACSFASTIPNYTQEELDFIKSTNTENVLVAPESDYPPFIFSSNNKIDGISFDYLKLIETKTGIKFSFLPADSLSNILNEIKNNSKAQIVTSLAPNEEREKFLDFTGSYAKIPAVIISKKDDLLHHQSIQELSKNNTKAAVGKDYGVQLYLEKNYPALKLVLVPNDSDAIKSVLSGESDIAVIDIASASYIIGQQKISSLSFGKNVGFEYNLSFGISKKEENKILLSVLTKAIESITKEEKTKVEAKWISSHVTTTASLFYTKYFWHFVAIIIFIVLAISVIALLYYKWNKTLAKQVKIRTMDLEDLKNTLEEKIKERTLELEKANKIAEQRVEDVEKINKIMIDRELKMQELKQEIEVLKNK